MMGGGGYFTSINLRDLKELNIIPTMSSKAELISGFLYMQMSI